MVFTMAMWDCPAPAASVGEFMTLIGTFKVLDPTATAATLWA